MDERTRIVRLIDFYGALITEHRREILRMRWEDDMSLSEIADEMNVTRQGVHGALVKAEKQLTEYEEKLGLVEKYDTAISRAKKCLAALDKNDINAARKILIEMTEDTEG